MVSTLASGPEFDSQTRQRVFLCVCMFSLCHVGCSVSLIARFVFLVSGQVGPQCRLVNSRLHCAMINKAHVSLLTGIVCLTMCEWHMSGSCLKHFPDFSVSYSWLAIWLIRLTLICPTELLV